MTLVLMILSESTSTRKITVGGVMQTVDIEKELYAGPLKKWPLMQRNICKAPATTRNSDQGRKGNTMEQRKWYYKNGTASETFSVLYSNGKFILVENDETKSISFGLERDFGSFLGFPVNWSCLTPEQAIDVLNGLIRIDSQPEYKEFRELEKSTIGKTQIDQWQEMIVAIKNNKPA